MFLAFFTGRDHFHLDFTAKMSKRAITPPALSLRGNRKAVVVFHFLTARRLGALTFNSRKYVQLLAPGVSCA